MGNARASQYTAGTKYHFQLVVDLTKHTYDVYVTVGTKVIKLATGYAFRTEQASAAQLSGLATFNVTGNATVSSPVVKALA